jgi:hypothetical protein
VLRIYPALNQKTAIQFVDYVLERLPFWVEVIQTDNGAEFQSAFHWHVLDKGINHTYIKPRTPRLNGKVERSHRIDAEEFYRLLERARRDRRRDRAGRKGPPQQRRAGMSLRLNSTDKGLGVAEPSACHSDAVKSSL